MSKSIEVYEKEAIELIKANNGILQSELWKQLGLDSREGSRIVLRLAKKGLIKRKQVIINGRRTYRLYLAENEASEATILVNLASILDIPCTVCPYLSQCQVGGFYSPTTCPLIDEWVSKKASGVHNGSQA